MTALATVVNRFFPDVDDRTWMLILAIGGFAVLAVKEVTLPVVVPCVGLLAGVVALAITRRLDPALPFYILVAYLPFGGLLSGDAADIPAVNPTNLLVAAAVLMAWWRLHAHRQPFIEPNPLTYTIILLGALGMFSLLGAGHRYGAWYASEHAVALIRWLKVLGLYLVTLWVVRDAKTLKTALALIMVAVAVVALMALWEYLDRAGSSFDKSRVQGIAGESNRLGAFFVAYMFLFLGAFLVRPKRWESWLFLGAFLLCSRALMATFSRGAYLAFAAAGLAACWFRHKGLFVAALAVVVMALANPSLLPAGVRYRMNMTVRPGSPSVLAQEDMTQNLEASSSTRVVIWRGALDLIRDHPWGGVGFAAFPQFIPHYTQGKVGYMDAHNGFLLLAAEMGIPILLVWLFTLCLIVYYASWLYGHTADGVLKAAALGVLAGVIGLVVSNCFSTTMDTSEEVVGYFWILAALMVRGAGLARGTSSA